MELVLTGASSLRFDSEQTVARRGVEVRDDVALAAAGDVSAFERVYTAHLHKVHSLVRRMTAGRDADELTQDVFVRVWQKLGSFRGDSAFATWLHRLAVNVVIERFRSDTVRRQRLHDGENVFVCERRPLPADSDPGRRIGRAPDLWRSGPRCLS